MARRTKRLWTDDEKRSICVQTTGPGVSVAQVARRYSMNANLIFTWLRDPRYAPEASAEPDEACFLPVEIVDRPINSSHSTPSSLILLRQRTSEEGSIGGSAGKTSRR